MSAAAGTVARPLAALAIVLLVGQGRVAAQDDAPALARGRISGVVIDAGTREPIAVRDQPAEPFGRGLTTGEEVERGQLAAVRHRRRRYQLTDVRTHTHAGVLEAVTLGETDLLRALQRLSAVGARDDYSDSAGLPVRGAAWDHTRVLFDGVPLLDPVHAAGVFAGIGSVRRRRRPPA